MGIYVQDDGNEKIYALTPEAKAWAMNRLKKEEEKEKKEEQQEERMEEESTHTNPEEEVEEPHEEEHLEPCDVKEEDEMDDQSDLSNDEGFKRLLAFLSEDSDDSDHLCALNNTKNAEKLSEVIQCEDPIEVEVMFPEDSVNADVEGLPGSKGEIDDLKYLMDLETVQPNASEEETEIKCSKELVGSEAGFLESTGNVFDVPEYQHDDPCPRLSLPLRYQEEEDAEDDEDEDQLLFRSCQNYLNAHTTNTELPGQVLNIAEEEKASCRSSPHHLEEEEDEEEDNEETNQVLFTSCQNLIIANTESNLGLPEHDGNAAEEERPPSPNLDSDQYTQAFLRQLVARHNAASENQSDIEEILDNLDLEAEERIPTHPRHPHAALLRQLAEGSEPESGEDEEPITRRPMNGMRLPTRRAGVPVFGERWEEEVRRRILEDADWEEEIESSIDTSEEEGSVDDLNVETPEESSLAEDDSSWQEDSVFEEESVSSAKSSPGKVLGAEGATERTERNTPQRTQIFGTSETTSGTLPPRDADEDNESNTTSCSSLSLPSLQDSPEDADEGVMQAPQILPPAATSGEKKRRLEVAGEGEGKTGVGNFLEESQHPLVSACDVSTAPGRDGESAKTAPSASESATSCVSSGANGGDAAPSGLLKQDYLTKQGAVDTMGFQMPVGRGGARSGGTRQRESTCSTRDALRSSHEAFVRGDNIIGMAPSIFLHLYCRKVSRFGNTS